MAIARSAHAIPEALVAALNAGDVAEALELWAPDAALVARDGSELRGHAAIGTALQAFVDAGVSMQIEVRGLIEAADVALVNGVLTLSAQSPDGRDVVERGESIVIYTRTPDGQWLIAIDYPWGLPEAVSSFASDPSHTDS